MPGRKKIYLNTTQLALTDVTCFFNTAELMCTSHSRTTFCVLKNENIIHILKTLIKGHCKIQNIIFSSKDFTLYVTIRMILLVTTIVLLVKPNAA
jgi:hypothetical protein